MPTSQKKNPPEKKISAVNSGITVSIWLNEAQGEKGTRYFRSITIEPRRYKDRTTGEWKDSPSFGPVDLPLLLYALEQARDYVFSEPLPGQDKDAVRGASDDDVPY
jgi:hypothetical protein